MEPCIRGFYTAPAAEPQPIAHHCTFYSLPQSNAGKANGIISKPRFKTALGMAFHQYALHEELIAAISLKYGCGAPDPHAGGYLEVLWRQFVIELQQYSPPVKPAAPDPFDPRITVAMSEMRQISEESGLNLAYALQACW